jgi:hypothetical protein
MCKEQQLRGASNKEWKKTKITMNHTIISQASSIIKHERPHAMREEQTKNLKNN